MREDYERWKSEKKGREKKKKNSTFSSIFCYQSLSDNFGVFVGHVVFITKNCRAYMTNLLSINKIRVLQKKKKKVNECWASSTKLANTNKKCLAIEKQIICWYRGEVDSFLTCSNIIKNHIQYCE